MLCGGKPIVLLLLSALSAAAQWLNYPTPGVPRLPGGSPDWNAPAPSASNGRADLSGIWIAEPNRPCPPYNCDDMLTPQEFWDIGWSVKGGIPYQPWAEELLKQREAAPRNGRPRLALSARRHR